MISIVIPAKNEPYLQNTVDSILENAEGDFEIIVGLDGYKEKLRKHPKVTVGYIPKGIGQRAATNALVTLAKGEYIMKTDAHCLFSQGFDVSLMEDIDDKTILAPYLLSLDAEKWEPRHYPKMSEYAFDTDLVMQHLPETSSELVVDTMCLQGSAWLVSKENYLKWNLGETELGSWGMQGTELGIKAYLNGGQCKTTKKCFYAHLFREKEADFPYKRNKIEIKKTRDKFVRKYKNKSIAGLIENFNYPLNWNQEIVAKLPDVV